MVSFIYPVGNVPITTPFIPGKHTGVDFSVPVGTPVHASAGGTVIYEANETEAGNTITVEHVPGSWQTRYHHLSVFRVPNGAIVKSGQVIGLSGGLQGAPGAGNSTGPHLHFEIRTNASTPVDPIPLLSGTVDPNGTGNAVELPTTDTGGISSIGDFFDVLTDGQTWVRVGEIIGSLGLFYIAYTILSKDLSSISQLRSAIK